MENEIPGSAINLLIKYLEELGKKDLKKFNVLLKNHQVKQGYSQIPRARLEKADCLTIADQMINHYREEYALEIAGSLLYTIPRRDLYEKWKCDSQTYLDKNSKLQKTTFEDHKKSYMRYMKEKFSYMKDNNSRPGEYISLNERYTKLLIIKEHCLQAEREHEIISSGRKHLEIMAQRAGHSYSSVAALFDPDKSGHVPRTVVLQGAAGIGKTMTARKIMLDWASGELFQGRFDYVFYINCREINQLSGPQTIAELLSHSCPEVSLSMKQIEAEPGKVLFIIDGFDELSISVDSMTGEPFRETQENNTVMSLIRRRCLGLSYIIITTRPTALEKLNDCVMASHFAEILGFSEVDRKEYFTKFFKDETQGAQAFYTVKGNGMVFTMCFVPIVCWIVCTVIKEQMENNEDPVCALKTTTSVYMLFLFNLLKQQSSDSVQPIHMNLKRLCALARDGVWEQKILFQEEDLIKHGLEIPAVQSLFLKNDIFLKATECENCYSFIHLSFQEFFAAMFYVLREDESSRGLLHYKRKRIKAIKSNLSADHTESPWGAVTSLLEASREQEHLMLTVRFLFGLLNKETLNQMENRFKWEMKSDIKPALLQWIKEEMKPGVSEINNARLELFHCLYEIQEEEFVKSATEHLKHIHISLASLYRRMTGMDFRALGFCIKNSRGVERIDITRLKMKPEDLRALIPGLMTCASLNILMCSLTASFCADLSSVVTTSKWLKWLNLTDNKLRDSGVRELCEALKHPGCKIQALAVDGCHLTASCCADLASVFSTNSSLIGLSLSNNQLRDSGVRELCEGLRHPGCKIQRMALICCSLTHTCCADLSFIFKTNISLKELHISENKLMDSGVGELCEGLKDPGCRIQTLGLERCFLTASCCTDLASVLRTNSSLTKLLLSGNKLRDSGVRELCAGLKHPCCKMQTLVLYDCSLTASCCADLSSVLSSNTSLTEIHLTQNKLKNRGVRELCEGLKHPGCKLQTLGLKSTKLTDGCAEALRSALRTNHTLQSLVLLGNRFTERSASSFSKLKETCKDLKLDYKMNKDWSRDEEAVSTFFRSTNEAPLTFDIPTDKQKCDGVSAVEDDTSHIKKKTKRS